MLWLWLWPAAVAPIRPLAWEPPHATGVALKIQIIIIITPYVAEWIDLGIIILSEVRKRKPNVIGYHLYVECKKIIQMNLFIKQNRLTN